MFVRESLFKNTFKKENVKENILTSGRSRYSPIWCSESVNLEWTLRLTMGYSWASLRGKKNKKRNKGQDSLLILSG